MTQTWQNIIIGFSMALSMNSFNFPATYLVSGQIAPKKLIITYLFRNHIMGLMIWGKGIYS